MRFNLHKFFYPLVCDMRSLCGLVVCPLSLSFSLRDSCYGAHSCLTQSGLRPRASLGVIMLNPSDTARLKLIKLGEELQLVTKLKWKVRVSELQLESFKLVGNKKETVIPLRASSATTDYFSSSMNYDDYCSHLTYLFIWKLLSFIHALGWVVKRQKLAATITHWSAASINQLLTNQ